MVWTPLWEGSRENRQEYLKKGPGSHGKKDIRQAIGKLGTDRSSTRKLIQNRKSWFKLFDRCLRIAEMIKMELNNQPKKINPSLLKFQFLRFMAEIIKIE